MKHCFYCGDEVTDRDYDYIGHQKTPVCTKPECVRELADANRAVAEHAALDAAKDGYERYWR